MVSVTTDRRQGVNASAAIKVACICASTGNLTLSAAQTIDGIAVVADDRVFAKDQTDATEIGIYRVQTGAWVREPDWNGAYDVREGTMIPVSRGTVNASTFWRVTNTGTITIGTTSLTVASQALDATAILSDGSVSMAADFLPGTSATHDLGSKTFQWEDIIQAGDLVQKEQADHSVSPAAGYGGWWVKSDSPNRAMFSDDADTDFYLSPPPKVSGHIRAGNTQLLSGAAAVTGVTITGLMVSGTEETFGPTGSGATNVWAAMDVIPSNATILIVGVSIDVLQDSTVTAGSVTVYASNGDDASYGTGDANIIGRAESYTADTSHRDGDENYATAYIPLGPTNQDFYAEYVAVNCTATVHLYYLGFMTD